jgi:transposase-like protein
MQRSEQRKSSPPECTVKGVLESLQRDTPHEAVCKDYGLTSSMLHRWKNECQTTSADSFADTRDPTQTAMSHGEAPGESPDALKNISGHLTVQNDRVKKCRGCWEKSYSPKGGTGSPALSSQRPLCHNAGRRGTRSRSSVAVSPKKTCTKRDNGGDCHRSLG